MDAFCSLFYLFQPETPPGFPLFSGYTPLPGSDLQTWLPELQALGAPGWCCAPNWAGPSPSRFLSGLKPAGIEPVIQFQLPLENLPDQREISMLLEVYARWGARYVVFFDQPNDAPGPGPLWLGAAGSGRAIPGSLPAGGQPGLRAWGWCLSFRHWNRVEAIGIPLFCAARCRPSSAASRRSCLQNLVLSAYAWTGGHTLDWGAGGPERWPQARPYLVPEGSQDQRGFRIFEWYQAVARSVLQQPCPMMLFQAGLPADPAAVPPQVTRRSYTTTCLDIARLVAGETVVDPCRGR